MFWRRLRGSVGGWLTTRDAAALYHMARKGPGAGAVVEIGSAYGLSTIVLAKGCARARRGPVHTMDTHTFYDSEAKLRANLAAFGVADSVIALKADSATTDYDPGPIRLIYIDGLHTYEGVRADIEKWAPRVVSGGLIAFDDYFDPRPEVGVKQAVDEFLETGIVTPELNRAEQLTWVTKR